MSHFQEKDIKYRKDTNTPKYNLRVEDFSSDSTLNLNTKEIRSDNENQTKQGLFNMELSSLDLNNKEKRQMTEDDDNSDCESIEKDSSIRSPDLSEKIISLFKEKLRNPTYNVTFIHGPIGLDLETDWYGHQAIVKGFKKLNGQEGLAKQCGLIRIGDMLTHINGKSCLELTFEETLMILKEAGKQEHTLHFKTFESIKDPSQYKHSGKLSLAREYIHNHKLHYYTAPEETELIYGCVEKHVGNSITSFNFHREDTGQFLLACSCSNDYSGDFLFHTIQDSHLRELKDIPLSEDSAVYLGIMTANFLGTEFTLKDHRSSSSSSLQTIKDLGIIEYESNLLGRVPNFLKVVIPREAPSLLTELDISLMSLSDRYKLFRTKRQGSLVERIRTLSFDKENSNENKNTIENLSYGAIEQEEQSDLLIFQTKRPSWKESLCAWTLNFNGRVHQASKKNFLLVSEEGNLRMENEFGQEKVFLRFGKMTKTRFTLDFRNPFSPFLALGIACTSFAKKLAVT